MLHFEKMENPEEMATMRIRLGLDKPLWAQYFDYVVGLFSGNLGLSMQDYSPVAQQIFFSISCNVRIGNLLYDIVLIGVFLGVQKSSKAYNKPKDQLIRAFGRALSDHPRLFPRTLQIIFGVALDWSPVSGTIYPSMEPRGLSIPLSVPPAGSITHFLLSSLAGLFLLGVLFRYGKNKT